MSELDNSMSMNSLMQAIYGEHHTQYVSEVEEHLVEEIPSFMQSLINHLVELCVTQGFADNVQKSLSPWIKQYILHQKNPKSTIEQFLKQFLRFFEQETQKINKYGQKKLKYLTQTVSKQIFTEIMRMACDLKLESVNRTNHLRSAHRRSNNIIIFIHAVSKLFVKEQSQSFRIIKKNHYTNIEKQEKFVQKLSNSINNLDKICVQKRRSRLYKAFCLWRKLKIEAEQHQSATTYENMKDFFMGILPQMLKAWQQNPMNWVVIIIQHVSNLVRNIVGGVEGILIEFLPNPNFQHISSLDYSALSSYRSGISQISSISIGEYLKTQEIKYDNNNKFVVIPIIAEQQIGLIKISWQYQLPIVLFNQTLKIVEELKPIIQGFAKVTTRLAYYNMEYEEGSWHQDLYALSFQQNISDFKYFQQILSAANISFLQIYHDKLNPNSCIHYGKQYGGPIPSNIYKIIWQKLQSTGSFILDRQLNNCSIMKLQNDKGFCRFAFDHMEPDSNQKKQLNGIIIQCIVPLLIKHLGKIGCPTCNIKVNQRIPNELAENKQNSNQKLTHINSMFIMKTRQALNIQQMQQCIFDIIKDVFHKTPVFARLFYPVSESHRKFAYQTYNVNKPVSSVSIPKILINENVCHIQPKQTDQQFIAFESVMRAHPLFVDSQIYLYQNQKKRTLKVTSKKIGRKAILIISTYEPYPDERMKQVMNLIGSQIEMNSNIFSKQDIHIWSSQKLYNKNFLSLPTSQTIQNLLLNANKLNFNDLITALCEKTSNPQQFFVWKVKKQQTIKIVSNIEIFNEFQLPNQLILSEQRIQSHASIAGVHRSTGASKNYGTKMSQFLSYIPNFSNEFSNVQFAELALSQMEGDGECAFKHITPVVDFLSQVSHFNKHLHQFISIPIKFQQFKYIVLLVYNKNIYITQQNLIAIQNMFIRLFLTLKTQQQLLSKQKALTQIKNKFLYYFHCNHKKQEELKKVVQKFVENRSMTIQKNKKLVQIINRIESGNLYSDLKRAFRRIQSEANKTRKTYENGCKYISDKLFLIFGLKPLINRTQKIKNKEKGVHRIFDALYKLLINDTHQGRISRLCFFQSLSTITRTKNQRIKNSKQIGAKLLFKKSNQIYRRNLLQVYLKTIESRLSLRRSLKILQQQFTLMSPKSLKLCLQFLEGRLNLMLSQHFMKQMPFKLVSSNYLDTDTQNFLYSQNIIFIQNTSFAVVNSVEDISVYKSTFEKFVQPTLQNILPSWEVKLRKHQLNRLKVIYTVLQNIRTDNLKLFFSIHLSQKNKQCIQECANMRKKTEQQKQNMQKLQNLCDASINILNRQKHRKQIDELKCEASIIQSKLLQNGFQANIKSKTNAAYRMLNILNKKKLIDLNQCQKQSASLKSKQLSQVKARIEEDNYRYFCQTLPTWISNVNKIIHRIQRKRQMEFFNNFIRFYS